MSAFLRKYGSAATIEIPVVKRGSVDFAVSGDWTPAAGDVKVSKDGGAAANIGSLPTAIAMGNAAVWQFSLTAAELQAARVVVTVSDSATKAVEDQAFVVETYGNASAQHAVDLDDSVRAGLTALPNAAADAAGGLPVSDAGALDIDTLLGRLDAAISTRSSHAAADVWSVGTRVLTGNTNLNDLDAAGVRSAVGLAASNLDTQLSTIDTVVDAIKAVTDNLPDSGALTSLATAAAIAALNDLSSAEAQTAANAALVALHLDHLLAVDYDPASKPGVATALLNELIGDDGGVSRFTANALEQAPSGSLTAAAIAAAMFTEDTGESYAGAHANSVVKQIADNAGGASANPTLLVSTTIATLTSQTVFTLTAGSADDDAYNGAMAVITDQATSTQKAFARVSDYDGGTKQVTLAGDPAVFTMAAGDTVKLVAEVPGLVTALDWIDTTVSTGEILGATNASRAAIFNAALLRLGEDEITDPNGSGTNESLLRSRYGSVRDRVLRSKNWNFALARAELAADSTAPDFEYDRAFTLPSDPYCLRVVRIYDIEGYDWKIEGRKILTDAPAPLKIVYVKRETDEAQYPADFVEALGAALAAAVAYKITNERSVEDRMVAAFKAEVDDAGTTDSQTGTPAPIDMGDDEWFEGRK